jgi:hypothetical protein
VSCGAGIKGNRTRWWKSGKPNHYFDATYQAIVACSMRGLGVLENSVDADHARRATDRACAAAYSVGCNVRTEPLVRGTAMPKSKDERPKPENVFIEAPIAEVPPQTWGPHINAHLTPEQSLTLRRVTAALDERLAKLSNGQRVINACGALQYLLEQIRAQ